MNRSQPENHEVIVKHVWVKLSARMPLIGQFFTESQSEISCRAWYLFFFREKTFNLGTEQWVVINLAVESITRIDL